MSVQRVLPPAEVSEPGGGDSQTRQSPLGSVLGQLKPIFINIFSFPNSIFMMLLMGFLAGRVGVLRLARNREWWDVFSYSLRGNAWDRGSVVSFTGHAPRLWGAPAFFALFEDDRARAIGQWTITTFAWALLAWALWAALSSVVAKVLASGAILVFGLLRPVTQWDFTILSESLSISLAVIIIACFITWVRTSSRVALIGMSAAAFYWTFVRAEIRMFMVFFCAVLLMYAWRSKRLRKGAITALVVCSVAIGWCSAIMPITYKHFQPYAHTLAPPDEELLLFKMPYIYSNPDVLEVYEKDLGMPKCAGAEKLFKETNNFYLMRDHYLASCPETRAWGLKNGNAAVPFVLAAPELYVKQLWGVLPDNFDAVDHYDWYGYVRPVLPGQIELLYFPPGYGGLAATFGGLIALIVAAFVLGVHQRRRLLFGTALFLAGVGIVGELIGVALAATEPARYSIQENFSIRLAIMFLLFACVDRYIERRRENKSAGQPVNESTSAAQPKVAL